MSKRYFIIAKDVLDDAQYKRVKKQIEDNWPEGLDRPILLEGSLEVVKL